jgi:hypothetical protein
VDISFEHQQLNELLKTLARHGERESALLDEYRHLISETADEGVKYLGALMLEELERHHHLVTEMVNRIESWDYGIDIEPSTPVLTARVDHQLVDATRHLIALERRDARVLRDLKRQLRGVHPTRLLPLLVSLMLHDTDRHIEILEVIHDYGG